MIVDRMGGQSGHTRSGICAAESMRFYTLIIIIIIFRYFYRTHMQEFHITFNFIGVQKPRNDTFVSWCD